MTSRQSPWTAWRTPRPGRGRGRGQDRGWDGTGTGSRSGEETTGQIRRGGCVSVSGGFTFYGFGVEREGHAFCRRVVTCCREDGGRERRGEMGGDSRWEGWVDREGGEGGGR